jgi:Ca2+-binding RTX toxin-like protein
MPSSANAQVLAAFALAPGLDLSNFDPIAATLSTDPTAQAQGAAAFAAAVVVQNTIVQATAVLEGAGATEGAALASVTAALAAQIASQAGPLDLTAASTVATLIDNAAAATPGVDAAVVGTVVDEASLIITASNALVTNTTATGAALLVEATQVAVVAQGDAAEALATATEAAATGDTTAIDGAVASFTGANLEAAGAAAPVGDVGGATNVTPEITTTVLAIDENEVTAGAVAAIDPDVPAQSLAYSIVLSAESDGALFTIDEATGVLSFLTAPDFENPTDADGDNVYDVTVQVSDSVATDTQALAVVISNVTGISPPASNAATITGTGEEDTLVGLGAANTLQGLSGYDTLSGGGGADILEGGLDDDTLNGGNGNDLLDGGPGNDTMVGGANNDTYTVDSLGDVITENPSGGTDTIRTGLNSYSLAAIANLEHITFTGEGDFTGTGNLLANTITGGGDNDTLDGAGGKDRLIGLSGNDTYHVGSSSDVVVETANAGADIVLATSARYTLSANVEDLIFVGNGDFNGTGNSIANTITGGSGLDSLSGGSGNDTLSGLGSDDSLSGGAGDDTFVATVADGNDSYTGNGGRDTYNLAATTSDAIVNLAAGTASSAEAGSDTLVSVENVIGGGGDDTITVNNAQNVLMGGLGDDVFVFQSTGAAGNGTNRDQIIDFNTLADIIDLSGIDANGGQAGNPPFLFVGEIVNVVNGKGQLARGEIGYHFETDANGVEHTIVEGNINANLAADFQIDLVGHHLLTGGDFIL